MKGTTKLLPLALVVLLALALSHLAWLPAYAQQTERAKNIGKRLLCMCNCNQILTACNHVGCSTSAAMLKKLDQVVARNEPDDLTVQSFIQEWASGSWLNRLPRASIGWPGLFPVGPSRWAWCSSWWSSHTGAVA